MRLKERDRADGGESEVKITGTNGGVVELEETGRSGRGADELVETVMMLSKAVSFTSVRLV